LKNFCVKLKKVWIFGKMIVDFHSGWGFVAVEQKNICRLKYKADSGPNYAEA